MRNRYDSDRINRVIKNAKKNGQKLTNNDDLEIMELYNSRKYNLSDIGYQFNRSGSTVRRSLKRMESLGYKVKWQQERPYNKSDRHEILKIPNQNDISTGEISTPFPIQYGFVRDYKVQNKPSNNRSRSKRETTRPFLFGLGTIAAATVTGAMLLLQMFGEYSGREQRYRERSSLVGIQAQTKEPANIFSAFIDQEDSQNLNNQLPWSGIDLQLRMQGINTDVLPSVHENEGDITDSLSKSGFD